MHQERALCAFGASDLLPPVVALLKQRTLADALLHTDDTGVRVLDREDARGIKRGHLWPYVGQGGNVFVEYTPDWSGTGPQGVLADFPGYLVADGYKGYQALFGPTAIRRCPGRPFLVPQAGEEGASVAPEAAVRKEPKKKRMPRVDWAKLSLPRFCGHIRSTPTFSSSLLPSAPNIDAALDLKPETRPGAVLALRSKNGVRLAPGLDV